jgi:AbiV family abortive infection protein
MLQNTKGKNRGQIDITDQVWNEVKKNTLNGIKEKISAAEAIVNNNQSSIDIAAALYSYAIDEFGKFLLLRSLSKTKSSNRRKIKYKDEFACHNKKFELAFDHLQTTGQGYCSVLNDQGSFSPISFSWRSFRLGLLTDFNAGYHYTDFKCSQGDIILKVRPSVKKNYLNRTIDELRSAVQELDASST